MDVRGRVLLLASAMQVGCAVPRQVFAPSDDYADYRAFRIAPDEGIRLARAERYLRRHPKGVWVDEVHAAFDDEEAAWFEGAKSSRTRARDYVVDLPHGPHIDAARALLATFDERETDIDMLELLAASRRTEAMLNLQAERRTHVGEVVLEELAALIDPQTYGASLYDLPRSMAVVLRGPTPRTWGGALTTLREDEAYFVVPTPHEDVACVAEVIFRLQLNHRRIVGGRIQGEDLFLRWAEANEVRFLDPNSAADRSHSANAAAEILGGALEGRMPSSKCAKRPNRAAGEILSRSCEGWRVSVRAGARAGESDILDVRKK